MRPVGSQLVKMWCFYFPAHKAEAIRPLLIS
jgi:hypothetical protein